MNTDQAVLAARAAYGRLLAMVASRSGDISQAEDALADAFESALRTWPQSGVPANPQAWLLTAARNRITDLWRSAAYQSRADFVEDEIESIAAEIDDDDLPDERLKLLLVCAHPAIDPAIHAPLMMQTVLGIEAEFIARAFIVPSTTMAQRLVRAKRKITQAGIRFSLPERADLSPRMDSVAEAIYGAYSIGLHDGASTERENGLVSETRFLSRLLTELAPDHAEALGLAALICFSQARVSARLNSQGEYVALDEQDPRLWSRSDIEEGEALLTRAGQCIAKGASLGRFQIEAAIQSVICARKDRTPADQLALLALHQGLLRIAPSVGATIAYATLVGDHAGGKAGLAILDALDPALITSYQPAWAARAHLYRAAGELDQARAAYSRAIELSLDPAQRGYLLQQRSTLQ
jgi:predicted RNA polymerase sigma factor